MHVRMNVCMYECMDVWMYVRMEVCATRTATNRLKQCQGTAGGYTTPGGGLIRDLLPKKWGPLLADVLLSRGPYLR